MKILCTNKKINFNYSTIEKYEAGISLLGPEVKSIKKADVSIDGAFVAIRKSEAWIINMFVKQYDKNSIVNFEETRNRKILLHKNQILQIQKEIKLKKLNVVPSKIYLSRNGLIKIEICLVKSLKKYEKREKEKEKDFIKEKKKILI